MPITLECPSCRRLTFVNDASAGPVPCSGCGQLLQAPAGAANQDVGSLLGGGTSGGAPESGSADSPWSGFSNRNVPPGETFKPVESNNPYQAPFAFEPAPRQVGWTGANDPRVADRFTRWLGSVVDGLFVVGLMIGGILLTAGFVKVDGRADELIAVIVYGWLGIGVVIQSVLITLYGQSVGKLLLGTKIVNLNDDDAPGFLRGVLLRYWLPAGLSIIPFFSFLDAVFIFGEEKRCIHDYLAATRVIRIR